VSLVVAGSFYCTMFFALFRPNRIVYGCTAAHNTDILHYFLPDDPLRYSQQPIVPLMAFQSDLRGILGLSPPHVTGVTT
jgi:hypothetical protein